MEEKLQRIKDIVEEELSCSAHNIEHVMRVYNLCLSLAKDEPKIDLFILKTSALLHDIARVKEDEDDTGMTDHAVLGAEMAGKILTNLGYTSEQIVKIKHCIITHRFRSGREPQTSEAKILFDADKLDVLGAIGIARSFMIAGQYGEKIYSDVPIEEYIRENLVCGKPDGRIKDISKHAPNIEFETKFKRIPGRLFTKRAREIAVIKLEYMKEFYENLRREIKGELIWMRSRTFSRSEINKMKY
jgi:uncharacterized protein